MTKEGKRILILLILLLLVWAGYFLYTERNRFWPKIPEGKIAPESKVEERKMVPPERTEQEPQLNLRVEEIVDYVSDNIDELSPVKSVLGGKWQVLRFWFAADYDFYVEYEDGHILRQILISLRGSDVDPQYNVVAYFEPGKDEWLLKKGEDIMYGKATILYERDKETGIWERRN